MIEYILKSSAALSVAYLLYFLFLRKYNNFKWLRLYFLAAILMSFLFPSLKYLPDFHRKDLIVVPTEYIPAWIDVRPNVSINIKQEPFTTAEVKTPHVLLSEIVKYAYLAGILFFLLRFVIGLSQLVILVLKSGVRRVGTDRFIIVKNLPCPFSFFHLIFINRHDLSDARRGAMLQHEREHVRQWHSLDLLLLEFITMVQWFNPFTWLIHRSLKEIHEYMADEGTINEQFSMLEYQQLLISQASGLKFYLPANGFTSSLTKKRILMITNKKRNRKWVTIFVLLAFSFIATESLSRINIAQNSSNTKRAEIAKSARKTSQTATQQEVKRDTISLVTKKVEFTAPPVAPPPPSTIKDSSNRISYTADQIEFEKENRVIMSAIGFSFSGSFDNGDKTIAFRSELTPKEIIVLYIQDEKLGSGMDQFYQYIEKKIDLSEFKDKEVIGEVYIKFIVTKDGKISDVTIERPSIISSFDKQLVKVITSAPSPYFAKKDGQPIEVPIVIKFTIGPKKII